MRTYQPDKETLRDWVARKKCEAQGNTKLWIEWYSWNEQEEMEKQKEKIIAEITDEEIEQARINDYSYSFGFRMMKTDEGMLSPSKARGHSHECNVCKKEMAKGMVLLGQGYARLCPKCAVPFLAKVEADLKAYTETAKKSREEFAKIDIAEWDKTNENKLMLDKIKGD
jgi:hypothetical protein